jgi:outer membrane protein assembly factor BamB
MTGRTLLAMDPASGKVRWRRRLAKPIDGRAVGMKDGRLYAYSHRNFLVCLDARTGQDIWRTRDPNLLAAIGPHYKAQFATTGYASSAYLKCTGKALYFAGPQRTKLVAASTADGRLLWTAEDGNVQVVIRDGSLYAMGSWKGKRCRKFDAMTGRLLKRYGFARVSCTRATGSADSVFCRGFATFRLDVADDQVRLVAPMRPPCNDGVLIAYGLLYWGPWMCDCNLSLIGSIALAAADTAARVAPYGPERLEVNASGKAPGPRAAPVGPRDWPTYRKDNLRSAGTDAAVPARVQERWRFVPAAPAAPTAPVAAGGTVLVGFDDGVVRALDADSGAERWRAYTGGAVLFPPTIAAGRAYVGSADGWVYCLNAADGRRLWRYRVAPAERRIPVYDRLSSTWPVASGVLVADGVAYAAAGIAHYDGSHLVALDAATGELKWHNGASGTLSGVYQSGVSVQGHLLLAGHRLYLAGGNSVSPAAYDARTGRCLEKVTRLQPYKGTKYSLHRGRDLYFAGGKVVPSGQVLYSPAVDLDRPLGTAEAVMHAFNGKAVVAKALGRRRRAVLLLPAGADPFTPSAPLWRKELFVKNLAMAAAANAAVVLGLERVPYGQPARAAVAALDLSDGRRLWRRPLPVPPVPWGLAVDRDGNVLVSLRDGRVLCLGASGEE